MATQTGARKIITKKQDDTLIDIKEVSSQTEHFFEQYQKPLIYGALALLLLVGGYFAYKFLYKDPKQKEAIAAMYKAEQMMERDSFAQALNGGGVNGFLDIIKKYGSLPAGNLSKYYAGVCYMNLGKFDDAISQLESFSASGDITPSMKYGMLGDAYSEKKDFGKALKNYKSAASEGSVDDIKAMYLKRFGMLSEIQNDPASALDAYKTIKEKYSTTSDGRDIDKYIARAEAKKK